MLYAVAKEITEGHFSPKNLIGQLVIKGFSGQRFHPTSGHPQVKIVLGLHLI